MEELTAYQELLRVADGKSRSWVDLVSPGVLQEADVRKWFLYFPDPENPSEGKVGCRICSQRASLFLWGKTSKFALPGGFKLLRDETKTINAKIRGHVK